MVEGYSLLFVYDFSKLFLQRLYSWLYVVPEVSVPLAYVQLVFYKFPYFPRDERKKEEPTVF